MEKELDAINKVGIENKAEKLYSLKTKYPENIISQRCLKFLKLEEAATISEK